MKYPLTLQRSGHIMCESPSVSSDLGAQTERHVVQSVSQSVTWFFFPCSCHNRDSDSAHVTVEAETSPPQTCWVRSTQTTKTSQATAYLKKHVFFCSREIGLGDLTYLKMLNLLWIFNISKKKLVLWFELKYVKRFCDFHICESPVRGSVVSQVISPSDKANQVLYYNTREPFQCVRCVHERFHVSVQSHLYSFTSDDITEGETDRQTDHHIDGWLTLTQVV